MCNILLTITITEFNFKFGNKEKKALMTKLKRHKPEIIDMDEGHANQAVCAPPPQLIGNRRRKLCLPTFDETSAPPAAPFAINRVPESTTILKIFSDTFKSHPGRESVSTAPVESAGDVESIGDDDLSEFSDFSATDPPSHPSLKEMLSQISLVDLGKQLTFAQNND